MQHLDDINEPTISKKSRSRTHANGYNSWMLAKSSLIDSKDGYNSPAPARDIANNKSPLG